MKIIPVPLISIIAGVLMASIFVDPKEMLPQGAVMLVMFLAAIAFFAWHSIRMKFVSVDFDNLYVSGWFKTDVIPLANLQFVHYSPGIGLVIVRLKSPCLFGGTIAFMPTWLNGLLAAFGQPSVVNELREMANNATARSLNAI